MKNYLFVGFFTPSPPVDLSLYWETSVTEEQKLLRNSPLHSNQTHWFPWIPHPHYYLSTWDHSQTHWYSRTPVPNSLLLGTQSQPTDILKIWDPLTNSLVSWDPPQALTTYWYSGLLHNWVVSWDPPPNSLVFWDPLPNSLVFCDPRSQPTTTWNPNLTHWYSENLGPPNNLTGILGPSTIHWFPGISLPNSLVFWAPPQWTCLLEFPSPTHWFPGILHPHYYCSCSCCYCCCVSSGPPSGGPLHWRCC